MVIGKRQTLHMHVTISPKKIIFINPSNFTKQYFTFVPSSEYRVTMNEAKSFVIQRIAKLQQTFKQIQAQTAIFHSKA